MWLVGMMGSGKTTVGERVSAAVGAPFYDTDRMIEDMTGMSIPSIFDSMGEPAFRDMERTALARVPETGVVAAAGGGAVLDAANREQMRKGAPVVWLRAAADTLVERLSPDGGRPLLVNSAPQVRLEEILEERRHLYADVATETVDTDDRGLDEVVADVVRIWRR